MTREEQEREYRELRDWCKRYETTPFNGLALAVAANGDASPLSVLKRAMILAGDALWPKK